MAPNHLILGNNKGQIDIILIKPTLLQRGDIPILMPTEIFFAIKKTNIKYNMSYVIGKVMRLH